jgi:hypothetical protein
MAPDVLAPADCELLHPGLEVGGYLGQDKYIKPNWAIPLLYSLNFDSTGIDSSLSACHVKSEPHDGGGAIIPSDAYLVERKADMGL